MLYARISMWEEESGLQVALYEANKLCGQAGVILGLPGRASTCATLTPLLPEGRSPDFLFTLLSSQTIPASRRPQQPTQDI